MRPHSLIVLAVMLAATPAFACTGQSVYLEGDLKLGDQGWGAVDQHFQVKGGEAVFTPEPGTQTARWDTVASLTAYSACVTLTMPDDDKSASRTYAGMLFWLTDKENFYEAVISPNGLFTVARKVRGRLLAAAPVPWAKSKAIKTGPGATNVLAVTVENGFVSVRINDEEVAHFRGQAPDGQSHIGLVAASAPDGIDTWHMSNLKATNVPPAGGEAKSDSADISTGAVTSAPGCGDGEVLFEDTFVTADPAWGPQDRRLKISSGQAELSPVPGTRTFRWNRVFVFDDIDACATVRLARPTADPTTSYAGLIFWVQDNRNYYQAVIAPNGYFTVARVVDGKVVEQRPVEWTKLDAVNTGAKEKNTLRVTAKGDEVEIAVNGKDAAKFSGEPPRAPSYIGMLAASAQGRRADVWSISDLKVSAPK
jgi:hypothetical protein